MVVVRAELLVDGTLFHPGAHRLKVTRHEQISVPTI
jgi:hypothetical protein